MSKYILVSGTDSTFVLLVTNDLQEAVVKRGVVTKEDLFKPKIYKLIDVDIQEQPE